MLRQVSVAAAVALAVTLALGTPALAGGWAMTIVQTLPAEVRAGQRYPIRHTILHHGKTRWTIPDEVPSEPGTVIRIRAQATGVAQVEAARAGRGR